PLRQPGRGHPCRADGAGHARLPARAGRSAQQEQLAGATRRRARRAVARRAARRARRLHRVRTYEAHRHMNRSDSTRVIRAATGTQLSARSWLTEAPLRMLMNNLDPAVAERPEELVVYGGIGRAARNWDCYDAIVATLKRLESDQTLLVQSGKPV